MVQIIAAERIQTKPKRIYREGIKHWNWKGGRKNTMVISIFTAPLIHTRINVAMSVSID